MSEKKKKKEFGLAAQLTQPRSAPESLETERPSPAGHSRIRQTTGVVEQPVLRPSPHYDLTEPPQLTARYQAPEQKKKPGAPPRAGGYVRRTITLDPSLSDFIDTAWRTHRDSNGEYVKGVSGFVESLIANYRHRSLTGGRQES